MRPPSSTHPAATSGSPTRWPATVRRCSWSWGSATTATAGGPLPRLLAEDFRVVVVRQPRASARATCRRARTRREMAGDALAVLDAAGIDRAHVVGTSLGGMVAQELGVRRTRSASTSSCSRARRPAAPTSSRCRSARSRRSPASRCSRPRRRYRLVVENALSDASVAKRPELVEEIVAYRLSHQPPMDGWHAQAAASADLRRAGTARAGPRPDARHARHRRPCRRLRNAQLLAEAIPGARVELFDELGHLFFWEEPERVVRSVREFLL